MSSTLVCPGCGARWKIVPEGAGDAWAPCPVCIERGRCTATHWRQAGVWLGWRRGGVQLVVELWTPFGQDARAWADRLVAPAAEDDEPRWLTPAELPDYGAGVMGRRRAQSAPRTV